MTFQLTDNSNTLKSFPKLCSKGSNLYPHLIPSVSHVIPHIVPFSNLNRIPLFIGTTINSNGTLNIINLDQNKTIPFYLVFYPDLEDTEPIFKEYCKTIQPMAICRDLSGYYLGFLNDSNAIMFEQSNSKDKECILYKIISGYDESSMQTTNSPILNDNPIYIRKKKL